MNPGDIPRIGEHGAAIALDWRVVVFTVLVSLGTGILFGLIPALDVSRADLTATLKAGGGRSGTGLRQNRTRSLLVISEVALALVLLVGAALLIRTFAALNAVDPGFDRHNILTMRMSLAGSRFQKTAEVNQLVTDAVQRIESLPGGSSRRRQLHSAARRCLRHALQHRGRAAAERVATMDAAGWASRPDYFDVFKIPVLRGRAFNDRDDACGAPRRDH